MKIFDLNEAIHLATIAHDGQRDMARQPYILHPVRVMMKQTSLNGMMAGILHDAIEDSNGKVTADSLRAGGCPEEVIEALTLLTHPKGITDVEYLVRIKDLKLNQIARDVKIADKAWHLEDQDLPWKRQARRRTRASTPQEMSLWRWTGDRRGYGYSKMLLWRRYFGVIGSDGYLIKYPPELDNAPHTDPVPAGHRHYRLNIVLRTGGARFSGDRVIFRIGERVILFRPDSVHSVTATKSERWLLSIGWMVPD